MKKRTMALIAAGLGIALAAVVAFSSGARAVAPAKAVPVAEIQYPFEKGKGLVNIRVEDVYLGVGMITGLQPEDGSISRDGFTGSVSFEMINPKPGIRIQVEGIEFFEKMPGGKEGRGWEPYRVTDREAAKGRPSRLKYLKGKEFFPFVWESGKDDLVSFTFLDLPPEVAQGELVITYQAQFPDRKRPAYYETRLPVTRKAYSRDR